VCRERQKNSRRVSKVGWQTQSERAVKMTLDELPLGQAARISEIKGEDAISIRLMEMGLTEGELIQARSVAPMGDPIEYEIRGYRLSLRITEARRVEIEIFS
jgi:ferrous iron transport protein A